MSIQTKILGTTKEGNEVLQYIMTNHEGNQVVLLNLGAVIQKIIVDDKDGNKEDVVLGYDTVEGYEKNVPSFGSPVGRCANRISEARFTLGGVEYQLEQNDDTNCLHGGYLRYNHLMYEVETNEAEDFDSISFSRVSPDGEQGFPGNLTLTITYTWNDANDLIVEYNAISDQDTIFNMTNHSYFNIGPGGHKCKNVLDQEVQIFSDQFNPIGAKRLPTGETKSVKGTCMDFTEFHKIGERIGEDTPDYVTISGYDHNYIVGTTPGEAKKIAALYCPENGRIMEVFTDMPGMQLYSAKELVETGGKEGTDYTHFGGVCFESQNYPNGINEPKFPAPILKAGEEFESVTVFHFGIEE